MAKQLPFERRRFLATGVFAGALSGLPGLAFAQRPASATSPNTPRRGGHVRLALQNGSVADTLDPAKGAHSGDFTKQFCVFNALTEFNDTLLPELALAEQLESADGVHWRIVLKRGITFHNGATLTAADVVYSLARHKDPAIASKGYALATAFQDIRATGPYEVALTLEAPNFALPAVLGNSYFLIVPDGTQDFSQPVGTGPYQVADFTPGGRFRATRNPHYWKPDLPYLDSVEVISVPDNAARVNAVLAGDIDICNLVQHNYAAQIQASEHVTLVTNQLAIYTNLILRQDHRLTGNPDFVAAVRYLQDRQRLVDTAMRGFGVIANDHPVAPWDPYYLEGLPQRPFDPDRARYHLQKSGLAGQTIDVYCQPGIATAVEGAQFLQSLGARVGFDFKLKRVPTDGYWSTYWAKQPMSYGAIVNRPDVGMIFELFYGAHSPTNEAQWREPKLDQLLAAARAERDFARRKAIYGDMQTLVHEHSGTIIPVFNTILDGVAESVHGYRPNPSGMNMGYRFAEAIWRR